MHLKIQNFTTAIRRLSEAHGSQIEANISPDHAIQYANEVDALVKDREKYETLRQAARALVEALNISVPVCDCEAVATRYMGWEGEAEYFCEKHAAEQLASNDPAPLINRETAIAPLLRALSPLLEAP